MSKVERCKAEEVYVVGFVPSHMLPKKRPISLDPFLEPLIADIEDGFISGIQVNYKLATCGKPAGKAAIRHLILCFSGDHNGLCEVGIFTKMRKSACRRCKPESVYVPETSHYYYPNFRRQARYPADKKNVLDNLELLSDITSEERISVRRRLSKESGYTGLSILHRLYYLYGFLYDRDMVYDEMHTVHLNIVKNAVLSLKEEEDDRVDWATADERLRDFPWTTEFKSSRIPKDMEKRLGYWKADDFNKFAFPASEVVFSGLLSHGQQQEWLCIARMVEFLQNHARHGWTESDAGTFQEMALRYAILLEDRRGTTACTMIVHNLLHFKEDTMNFSGQDNYSCWNKERAVRRYVRQPNNQKNIECTFAATEERREALKFRKEPKEQGPHPQKTDPNKLWAKSIEQARKLYCTDDQVHRQADITGILVGGAHSLTLDVTVRQTIANEQCLPITDIEEDATRFRSVWFPCHSYDGLLYREKEHAVVITQDGESIVKLLDLLCVFVIDQWKLFLRAKKFEEQGFSNNGLKVVSEMENDTVVVPLRNVSRKVMLFVHERDEAGRPSYIVIDFMRRIFPISAGTVVVPYYPVKNDMILVRGDDEDSLWKALVLAFSMRRKTVTVKFFEKQSDRIWIPENSPAQEVHLNSVLGIDFDGDWSTRYTHWEEFQH